MIKKYHQEFFKQIPTVWDDTKVMEGKIGEFATIARKFLNRFPFQQPLAKPANSPTAGFAASANQRS